MVTFTFDYINIKKGEEYHLEGKGLLCIVTLKAEHKQDKSKEMTFKDKLLGKFKVIDYK